MLHCFNVSLFYVARFDVTLFIFALAHVALCAYYTVLCSPILILCHFMLHCNIVSLFDVELLDDALFNVALFNVSLFDLALFNVALFSVALFKVASC